MEAKLKDAHATAAMPGLQPSERRERGFVEAWVRRRRDASMNLLSGLGVIDHLVSLALLPLIVHESVRYPIMFIHAVALVGVFISLAVRRRRRLRQSMLSTIVVAFMVLYVALLGYVMRVLESNVDILIASAGAIGYAVFGIQLYPGSRVTLIFAVVAVVGLGIVLPLTTPGGLAWGIIFAAICLLMLTVRMLQDAALEREAASEYRFRSLVAPAHVVRRSLDSAETLLDAFKTELKFCVCIASDWRDYQAFSSQLSPSQLTMTLSEYYSLCTRILERCLPEGNYYTDWIADELFVVLYAHGEMDDAKLIDAAMRFSSELIQAKNAFARVHHLPKAIDIGISAGEALLGLMGPEGHKKATALGSVPGRARRFQGAGKLLRLRRGDRDRIVFGRECLMRIKVPHRVEEMMLAENEGIRDVPDRELFFIEPNFVGGTPDRGVA